MELIWALTKVIQYLVIGPVWWVSCYLASFFYPLEGDSNQDLVAMFFALLIFIGMIFGMVVWLDSTPP